MTKLRIVLCIITVASLAAGHVISPERKVDERPYLNEVAPEVQFSDKQGVPPYYESESGIAAFNTYDVVPEIAGYAGPVKLLLAIDNEGTITGIRILEHKETKNYVHYMVSPEYLRQFLGKSVHDPFEPDNDIDAISRATESVQALTETVRESSRNIAARVYDIKVQGDKRGKTSGAGWMLYLVLFLSAFMLYYVTRKSGRFLRARDICLVLGTAVIGMYLATPFSILHVFNVLLLRFSSSMLWLVIVITTFLSIALAGRFYCGWLCPFGALAEFIGRMSPRKWEISAEADEKWRRTKYVLLGLVVFMALAGRQAGYGNFETYITLFSFHGNVLAWLLVFFMLLANIRMERFWCRYLCPVAAFAGLLSRKDSGYKSRKDCPMRNRHNPHISECIRCNRCYGGDHAPGK